MINSSLILSFVKVLKGVQWNALMCLILSLCEMINNWANVLNLFLHTNIIFIVKHLNLEMLGVYKRHLKSGQLSLCNIVKSIL